MSFPIYCGPFQFNVKWSSPEKPVGLKHSTMRLLKTDGLDPIESVNLEILDSVVSLNLPPKDALELKQNWRIWQSIHSDTKSNYVVQIYSGMTEDYAIECLVSSDFRNVKLVCLRSHPRKNFLPFLLATIIRFVTSHLAIEFGGFMIHCAALQNVKGNVILGIGPSGAGKTTFSRFFMRSQNFKILTDETSVILKHEKKFMAFGTPWPGMLNKGINNGGPVVRACFLEKTLDHFVNDLQDKPAFLQLIKEIFISPWNRQVTEQVLDSVSEFISLVPQQTLGFRKSKSIVPFVEENL